MPAWHLPVEPDTRLHAVLRAILYVLVTVLYLTAMVLHFLQVIRIGMMGMTVLATMMVLAIPAIQYLVRPGKGITWLLTILLMPVFVFMPITVFLALVVLPVALLIAQALKAYKAGDASRRSCEGGGQERGENG